MAIDSVWKKLGRTYRWTALLVMHVFVVLIVGNGIAALILASQSVTSSPPPAAHVTAAVEQIYAGWSSGDRAEL